MDTMQICLGLAAFCIGLLAVTLFDTFLAASRAKGLILVALVACITGICCVGAELSGGEAFDQALSGVFMEFKPIPLIIAMAGLMVGAGWGVMATIGQRAGKISHVLTTTLIVSLSTVTAGLVVAWDEEFDIERFQPSVLDTTYTIEELVRTEQVPIRLALDESNHKLYFSTYETGINGVYSGSIFCLPTLDQNAPVVPTIAISSPGLYRPFGLACYEGDIYVSRAGHSANYRDGIVEYGNFGAVTQLKDLDGDGQFEFLHDVLQGIPAARGPDTMHQNNGIVFDAAGNLFIAVGSNDDRSIDQHVWAGTILQLRPESAQPEVFAKGLRNPFGICCGPTGSLFVTDNDCSEDPGDEINFVLHGKHFGHPFTVPGEGRAESFTDPLVMGPDSNYCGTAFLPSTETPGKSGHLFVCDRLKNSILRLKISVQDGKCSVLENDVFARVPMPLDIVISNTGELFVSSFSKQKIYRISPK